MRYQSRNTTSQDQNFFLYPLHGDLLRSARIRIHYDCKFPLGLDSYFCGATFGRDVYLTDSAPCSGAEFTPAFQTQVQLLIHELAHCQQYQAVGWSVPRFLCKYIWGLCRAGFKYSKNAVEIEAFALEDEVDHLLFTHHGRLFFQVWRDRGLFGVLGYPIAKTYEVFDPGPGTGTKTGELEFERGFLQVSERGCWRYARKRAVGRKRVRCRMSGWRE